MAQNNTRRTTGVNVLRLDGTTETVGTPSVTVLERDSSDKVLLASGATVPSDADAGYAKGCIFIKTGGGVGTTLYMNEGSSSSADFNAIGSASGGATTALDNLASVAINTSLISDTDNTDDLGSAAKEWKDLYIDGVGYIDTVQTDLIQEDTAGNGVSIDGVTLKDGGVTFTAGITGTSATLSSTLDVTGNVTMSGDLTVSGTITGTSIAQDSLTASTTNGALSLDGNGTGGVDINTTGTGTITLGANVSVSASKTVTLTGGAGSDALILTAGHLQMTNGDIDVDEGKIEVDTTTDETSYIKRNQAATTGPVFEVEETNSAADNAVLLIDQNATAAASYGLEIDSEGGTGIHFAAMVAAGDGILFDVADSYTGQLIVGDLGPWLGTSGEGAIELKTDAAATIPAGTLLRLDQNGTGQHSSAIAGSCIFVDDQAAAPGAGTSYAVYINAANIAALHVDSGAVQLDGTLTVGVDDTGADVKFFGATTNKFMVWDESADDLILADGVALQLGGDESTADGFKLEFDGTATLALDALTANDSFTIGANTATDVSLQGLTAGADVNWDASANKLTVTAGATLVVAGATSGDGTTGLEIPYHATATPSGAPGTGSIFFEVDANKLWVYNGTTWVGATLS